MSTTLPTERYTPGYSANATAFMAERDVESHGFFLAPILERGFRVLDVGCGPGTITAGIADAVFPGRVTAVDASLSQLEGARRLSEGREIVNMQFVNASANAMPFADGSFDVVFAHALLEHLGDPVGALREFWRVTQHGGFVAVCSPDWDEFEIDPFPDGMARAIVAYRGLQEANGGDTRAGARLGAWIGEAGFTPLSCSGWIEEYENPGRIAEYLARQLDASGFADEAGALRGWASVSGASFRQSWKYAIGLKLE